LIRRTWNTDIIEELKPEPGDISLYKTRFSGFYKTDLDSILQSQGARFLTVTGCTTSVCVESTIRDAVFRDYSPILLSDCTAEVIGSDLPRSNHEASLFLIQQRFAGCQLLISSFGQLTHAHQEIRHPERNPVYLPTSQFRGPPARQ
jgi:ureidoacrylate peracid hydrolase